MTSQNIILNRIKYFQAEYPDGVPINILKLDLDLSVNELQDTLLNLEKQGYLFIENEEYVKLVETSIESDEKSNEYFSNDNTPEENRQLDSTITTSKVPKGPEREDVELYDLSEREMKALEMIKSIIDDSGHISRHILEGNLLYGDLNLNTLGVYNLIMSLENKGIIRKIQIADSEYYAV
ncbi:MAG: hypothetical protein LLF83_09150 [Methanobacterium sp.]|nr:hypothetical protein [Methanobacterium sp.]